MFFLLCFNAYAEESSVYSTTESYVELLKKDKLEIDKKIETLNKNLVSLNALQLKLISNIESGINFQQEIQSATTKLLNIQEKQDHLNPLEIRLLQPTNLYIFVLPLVTIFIVLGSTFLSLRTIKIKSQEALYALRDSNENQLYISNENNKSERLKSQEAIISNNRQDWIDSLRNELSSLLSHLTQYTIASDERQDQIFSKIWKEVYKIELLLNPNEDNHKKLINEVRKAFSLCGKPDEEKEFKTQTELVLKLSKKVLKIEWQRVKSFN